MRVDALDHVNISTRDVEASARFYANALDLDPRCNSLQMSPDEGRWLYDHSGNPIIHLRKYESDGASTGPIHHVAFKCVGMAETVERLTALGIEHRINNMEHAGFKQVFIKDPNGVLLELNFTGE